MLPVFMSPLGSKNANFASRVEALKDRRASDNDSLLDLLNATVATVDEEVGKEPDVDGGGAGAFPLNRPVHNFGGSLSMGLFCLLSSLIPRSTCSS